MSHGNIYSPEQWAFIDLCLTRGYRVTISDEKALWKHGYKQVTLTAVGVHPSRTVLIKSIHADRLCEKINGESVVEKADAGPPPLYGDPTPKTPSQMGAYAQAIANPERCEKCHKPMRTFGRCDECGFVPGRVTLPKIRAHVVVK